MYAKCDEEVKFVYDSIIMWMVMGNRPNDVEEQSLRFLKKFGGDSMFVKDRQMMQKWTAAIAELGLSVQQKGLSDSFKAENEENFTLFEQLVALCEIVATEFAKL